MITPATITVPADSSASRNPRPASRRSSNRARRRAFTLLEIIIVIALIAGLMIALLPQLGSMFTSGQEDTERIKIKNTLGTALQRYRLDIGSFPTDEEGLQVLLTAPATVGARWRGPYLEDETALIDSWRSPYNYKSPGTHNVKGYDLWSNGNNRVNDNGGGDDIVNWNK